MLDTLDMDETKQADLTKTWLARIESAIKREKKFRDKGNTVVNLYEGKKADETPFAIVYSNTETLQPALYNQRPVPIVARRFKDADPIGKAAAETSTRLLKFLIDTEAEDYDNYDELNQTAVLDAILVNRGVTRFKYVAHEGAAYSECVYGEAVRWDKFFHGYARTWKKVPWIGFEWDMTAAEIKKNFPNVSPMDFRAGAVAGNEDTDNKLEDRDELEGTSLYKVYEIWDKATKKVLFFSAVSREGPLRAADDPLGLSGFFPIPRPINFTKKSSTLIPTPLYEQYKSQAAELNEITRRLKAIIKAIRFRGAYNSTIEGIEKMLAADDNELVPVDNMASMPEGTTMDKMLYVVPVNDLVSTAQSLYQQRESCKQVIYEITGISDILRGASQASETATAQNIKNQWGSLRLKKMQKEVQRYCRESLAIMLEIAAAKFELTTIQQMTGLPYLLQSQKQQIGGQIQAATMRYTTTVQAAQASGQPPPGQPPQLPPELEQLMNLPSWEDITKLLQNDVARAYKTDIETNSTIDAEAAQDKQDIAELLTAMSQFLQNIGPLIEQGVLPMEVAKEILLTITRRYNFGSNLEEMLQMMGQPKPPPAPDPAVIAEQQAQQAADQAKLAAITAKAQADTEKTKLDMQRENMKFQNDMARMQAEALLDKQRLAIQQAELQLQERALELKTTQQKAAHDQKMEALRAKETSSASV